MRRNCSACRVQRQSHETGEYREEAHKEVNRPWAEHSLGAKAMLSLRLGISRWLWA